MFLSESHSVTAFVLFQTVFFANAVFFLLIGFGQFYKTVFILALLATNKKFQKTTAHKAFQANCIYATEQ